MKNLIARTLSGLLFLAIMIGCILWNVYAFFGLSCVIVVVGMIEFFNMFIPKANKWQKILSICAGICLISFVFIAKNISVLEIIYVENLFIASLIFLTSIPIIELYTKSEEPAKNIALLIIPVFYIVLPFMLMQTMNDDSDKLLAFFILIWANDVGAYCFGMLFGQHGKHKLFPRISPKKSWEGFIGGIITAIAASILVSKFMLHENMHHWIIIAIITAVLGTFGDLVESMLKRSAGVKDSGKIIPGHGGILDRFDAVLLSFPIVFVYIKIFILI
ncbi:MAG: phosphatidate cytidylyltransferase [Prevotellaceae bacterium]|jgi:phosphatidate cytidylyltransferase|nr:phosphatidate cytidylyltransferase [Prevotellaceae bacterium]